MNVAVRTMNSRLFQFPEIRLSFSTQPRLLTIGLLFAIFISAFGLIYVKDVNRRLTGSLQSMQNDDQFARSQYSQLLLEKGTWTSSLHIEEIAVRQLHMISPPPKSVTII
jgi:cell division protein FtsL